MFFDCILKMSFEGLSSTAMDLHERMMEGKVGEDRKLYTKMDLQKYCKDPETLLKLIQELVNNSLVKPAQRGDEVLFEPVSHQSAAKVQDMSGDEAMVYQCIEATGRDGIWTKSIKMRTQLHQTVVLRTIKSLESRRLIKSIKSVKNPTRKIYMLYHLEPSAEVTGGPWFTDSEMDADFINGLLMAVWKFCVQRSFPQDDDHEDLGEEQKSFPAEYRGYPTVNEIHDFVTNVGILQQDAQLGPTDIRHLCEVLVHDDLLERRDMGQQYKATWHGVLRDYENRRGEALDALSETPCGACPSFNICEMNGPVNANDCVYLDDWLSPPVQTA